VNDPNLPRRAGDLAPANSSASRRGRRLVLIAAFLGWMFDGLEMGIFPLVARPALTEILGVADDELIGRWFGRLTCVFLLGAALGGLVFGWLGDRIGRVRAMTVSILTYSLFTGACYFPSEPWQLAGLRFVAALGMGGEWSLGVALVMESWPGVARPLLAGIIGAAANVGFLLIALIALKFRVTVDSWRWVMLAGAAPALLTFFIRLFVPESERWKDSVKTGRSEPLAEVFAPGLWRTTLLAIGLASVALVGTWGSVQWAPNWVDKLTGGTQPEAKAWAQTFSALGAIVGCFAGALLGGRLGRRPVYFGLCLASLAACAFLFLGHSSYGPRLLVAMALTGACTAAFYGWLPLYLPELFPTRARATGQGLSFNFGRVIAAAGVLLTGELVGAFGGDWARAGFTISTVYVVGLVLVWLAPETRGRPLPD
jgi:MFS family permease